MDDNRAAILAAMYQDDDIDEVEDLNAVEDGSYSPVPGAKTGRTRRVRVGAIEYELPSLEYVQQLERLIAQQSQALLKQGRMIDRLAAVLGRTRGAQQLHRLQTDELRREIATKLTVRSSSAT